MTENKDMNLKGYDADFYKSLVTSLDNNSVLRVKSSEGIYVPISCSREFAAMMECTPEEFIASETNSPSLPFTRTTEKRPHTFWNTATRRTAAHTL